MKSNYIVDLSYVDKNKARAQKAQQKKDEWADIVACIIFVVGMAVALVAGFLVRDYTTLGQRAADLITIVLFAINIAIAFYFKRVLSK